MIDTPVCILFSDYSIRAHVTLSSLQEIVSKDILDRYGVSTKEICPRDEILLDPGGLAFVGERAEYLDIEYNGIKFSCQTIHLFKTIQTMRMKQGMMETDKGALVRLYFPDYVLVLPMEWLWPIITYLESFSEEGKKAGEDLKELLRR